MIDKRLPMARGECVFRASDIHLQAKIKPMMERDVWAAG